MPPEEDGEAVPPLEEALLPPEAPADAVGEGGASEVVRLLEERRSCCHKCCMKIICFHGVGAFGVMALVCAVIAIVIMAVTLGSVYGIMYQPNLNVRSFDWDGSTLSFVANVHNSNAYKSTYAVDDIALVVKAGSKHRLGRFHARGGDVTVDEYAGAHITLVNKTALDAPAWRKLQAECADGGNVKLKASGAVKSKKASGSSGFKRLNVVSQWATPSC